MGLRVAEATKACWILRNRGELRRDLVERASLLELLLRGAYFFLLGAEDDVAELACPGDAGFS
ncbi:MAG TPA: hypothetical protein VFA85_17555 [Terriglobales bacterium]|nr:hypothetical protein [Terriglobales bacterium]